MRDTWCCRQYPGGLPVGVIHEEHTRDTCRTQRLPGNIIRETRGALGGFREGPVSLGTRDTWHTRMAPGGFSRLGFSGHVALSEGKSEGGSEGGLSGWHSGHVVCSERVAKEVFRSGMFRRGSEGGVRRGFGTRGVFRRWFRKRFRRGFRGS